VFLLDAVRLDLPKPRLYSLFIVPEAPARLAQLRALLRELEERGVGVLVSHDQHALESSGIVAR
jgi:hypothetical protein